MHAIKPTVYRLPVHLEDQQLVYYNPDNNPNEVLERGANKETQLTAWFKTNQSNSNARNTTYQNFPQTWVYDSKTKVWKPRQCGQAISRMYFASPSSGEWFYLQLLLTVVPGATSFAHLCTVNNIPYNTLKEACFVLGLLEDDQSQVDTVSWRSWPNADRLHSLHALFYHSLPFQSNFAWDSLESIQTPYL